jgi:hypothetical protein
MRRILSQNAALAYRSARVKLVNLGTVRKVDWINARKVWRLDRLGSSTNMTSMIGLIR